MHLITVSPASRLLVSTQMVATDDPLDYPCVRLQLRTDHDSGVILDLDPDGLYLLTSSLKTLLAAYRAAERQRSRRQPFTRSIPRRLPI